MEATVYDNQPFGDMHQWRNAKGTNGYGTSALKDVADNDMKITAFTIEEANEINHPDTLLLSMDKNPSEIPSYYSICLCKYKTGYGVV